MYKPLDYREFYTHPQLLKHIDTLTALVPEMTEGGYQQLATIETIRCLKAALSLYEEVQENPDGS